MKEEVAKAIRTASRQIKANANWFAKNYATIRDWFEKHNEKNNLSEFCLVCGLRFFFASCFLFFFFVVVLYE
jgi:hypothetical protein